MNVTVEEEDRQMILLALAWLSLDRPGWDDTLGMMADNFHGREMFEKFKEFNSDKVKQNIKHVDKILEEMRDYAY